MPYALLVLYAAGTKNDALLFFLQSIETTPNSVK